jgi:(p)ppGpp synthase/HD superfamily hydrolase
MLKQYDTRTKHFIKEISWLSRRDYFPLTNEALKLLLNTMGVEHGYTRHGGQDYYCHPIALAQTALDFQLVDYRIRVGKTHDADLLLAGCLLHDYLEDVDNNKQSFVKMFGEELWQIVDNVTKRTGESTEEYLDRATSHELSSLIKVLDRVNNVTTLSDATDEFRRRQWTETKEYYLPMLKLVRSKYWIDRPVYWQAKTVLEAVLRELDRYFELLDRCNDDKQ